MVLRILYLVNKKTYQTKMSRVRFHGIQALEKIANVHYSGIGWNDYNNNITVQQNIDAMDTQFEIVIVYKPLELKNFKQVTIPKCIRYNEMYDIRWTLKEITDSGSQLVICHHLNDCASYQKMNLPGVQFVYIGHCAEQTVFKDYQVPKKYDIMLGGKLSSHYPLRNRLYNILLQLRNQYTIYIHPHPGYDLNDAHTNKYLIDFAKKINESKIVVTDSGKPRTRFGKYIEVPACNTVLAADFPLDSADDYSYLIQLDMSMSDQDIKNKLKQYLENQDLYEQKRKKGLAFAKEYTQEKYAERLVKEIQIFL